MVLVESFPLAVALCFITMLCWGSWANTQKLTGRDWPFQLFYWDYSLGVLALAAAAAVTAGSLGPAGRPFLADLAQADRSALVSAFLGGVIFNLSNILLVAAIGIAGMAVAFPVGVGLALVIGVATSYLAKPVGSPVTIALGVAAIMGAIILDAVAYRRVATSRTASPGLGAIDVSGSEPAESDPPQAASRGAVTPTAAAPAAPRSRSRRSIVSSVSVRRFADGWSAG